MKVIPISGVIGWDVTGQSVREALAAAKGDEIEIHLSSVGGLVFDGLEIFNLIKNYEGKKTARLMGIAASMGSYIPLAADCIVAEGNAVMMIHNAWGIGMGNADDLRAEAAVLEGLSAILADAYVKKTGKPLDEIKAMMDAETWFFGQEMVDAGFVDEIAGAPTEDKEEKVKAARAELVAAKKLVAEYEGGDSPRRVAALVESMRPRVAQIEKTPGVAEVAEKAKPKNKETKMNTLEDLKAEHPAIYAQAIEAGRKAERDRVAELAPWRGISAAVDSIVEDAAATGKSYAEVASQLNAAVAKGPKAAGNDNPPVIGSTVVETASGAGNVVTLDEAEKAVAKGLGITEEAMLAQKKKDMKNG